MIKALLIDDKEEYCISISGEARSHDILIEHTQNLELGMIKLKEDIGYEFVILDGKCLLEEGQEIPKENFVHEAIEQIKSLKYSDNRHIPFCVNTGYMKDLKSSLDNRGIRIFDKDHKSEPLFNHIKDSVRLNPLSILKEKHPSIFSLYDRKILEGERMIKVISLLEFDEDTKASKEQFNLIREVLEDVFLVLMEKFNHFPHEAFFGSDGRPNLSYCSIYLSGRKTKLRETEEQFDPIYDTPIHISWTIGYVKEVSSILSHSYGDSFDLYSMISVRNALFEILSWLPTYIDENYSNK